MSNICTIMQFFTDCSMMWKFTHYILYYVFLNSHSVSLTLSDILSKDYERYSLKSSFIYKELYSILNCDLKIVYVLPLDFIIVFLFTEPFSKLSVHSAGHRTYNWQLDGRGLQIHVFSERIPSEIRCVAKNCECF